MTYAYRAGFLEDNFERAFDLASSILNLLAKIAILAYDQGIDEFRSHVYKANLSPIALHLKSGFHVTRQNEKGFEFFITVREMTSRPAAQRAVTGIFRFQPGSPE